MKQVLVTTVLLVCSAMAAEANDRIEKAQRFLKALETGDMATAAPLMHTDITFEDPTFSDRLHEGKEALLRIYAGYTAGAHNLKSQMTQAFESNGTVVLDYMYYVEMDLKPGGAPKDRVSLMGRGLRVIGFKDGKIIRHIDLADYGQVNAAIAALQAKE